MIFFLPVKDFLHLPVGIRKTGEPPDCYIHNALFTKHVIKGLDVDEILCIVVYMLGDVLLVVGSLLYLQVSSHILVLRDVP